MPPQGILLKALLPWKSPPLPPPVQRMPARAPRQKVTSLPSHQRQRGFSLGREGVGEAERGGWAVEEPPLSGETPAEFSPTLHWVDFTIKRHQQKPSHLCCRFRISGGLSSKTAPRFALRQRRLKVGGGQIFAHGAQCLLLGFPPSAPCRDAWIQALAFSHRFSLWPCRTGLLQRMPGI